MSCWDSGTQISDMLTGALLLSKLKSWSNSCKGPIVGEFDAPYINCGNLEVGPSKTSFDYKLLEITITLALFQNIGGDLKNSSLLD